eukprot:2264844-Amphidinium_carterae.1
MLAVQAHPELDSVAVAGFLRDRGLSWQVRRDWSLDRTLQLQKLVLMNLNQLKKLGIEYCRYLRKSEDLALCLEVAQNPGGRILKAHCYCYRALHLEQQKCGVIVGVVSHLVRGCCWMATCHR